MSDFFWIAVAWIGNMVIALVSLILALTVALWSLRGLSALLFWRADRRRQSEEESANEEMHGCIRAFLREELTTQE